MALNLVRGAAVSFPSPADVNEPATPTHSAAGAHRSARWRRATAVLAVTGAAPARAPGTRAARQRGRHGRGRIPRRRGRRQRRLRGSRAAPCARLAAARRARAARRLVGPGRPRRLRRARPQRAARGRHAHRGAPHALARAGRRAPGSRARQARGGERDRQLRAPAHRPAAAQACTPARCEVVQVGGTPLARASTSRASGSHDRRPGDAHLARALRLRRAHDPADRQRHAAPSRSCSRQHPRSRRRSLRCACSPAATAGRRPSPPGARTSGTSTACSQPRGGRRRA